MVHNFRILKDQSGSTSIFLSMVLAASLGTAVYFNMDKLNQTLKSNKITSQKQKAETRNISGLSQATALMRYTGASPQSDDPLALPYIYPDPYLSGSVIGTTRNLPNAPTWTFQQMKLEIMSPSDSNLQPAAFDAYARKDLRPDLTSKSSVRFIKPIRSDANHPFWITHYEAEVSSSSFDNQSLISKATVPVPTPLAPKCVLSSADGQTTFQPNTPMNFNLTVSGVAVHARVPVTTEALGAPEGTFQFHKEIDLTEKSNSIRKINNSVFSWIATTPRPLVAVDGKDEVTFTSYAYLTPVDIGSETAVSCSFTYTVTSPATCKLWTDKASVSPGQCVNITSATLGPVKAQSLVLSASDPIGKPVAGLTQKGSSGTFCAPAVSSYATGLVVPNGAAEKFNGAISSLTSDQEKALYDQLAKLQADLGLLFANQPELQSLSINQFNDLWNIGPSQLLALPLLDLNAFTHLSTLTDDQQVVLKSLTDLDFAPLSSMKPIDLESVELLADANLDKGVRKKLASYDSNLLLSAIGTHLDDAAASSAVPVDYKISGTVIADDGSKNSCLVHVTSGVNQCPFFGSQFPKYTQRQTVTVIYEGKQTSFSFDFAPSNPNWEVAGIATSPTHVDPCPAGARCFAVAGRDNRTPFVTVDSASSKSCNANANQRIDLGCFAADTLIRMADGTDRPIRQLKDHDLVFNPLRNQAVAIKRVTQGPEKLPLWSIQTTEGQVQVTSKHPFITARGLLTAEELKLGDFIKGTAGEVRIQNIKIANELSQDWVWNFALATDSKDPKDHAILANGVVTGDLFLQEQIAQGKTKTLSQLKRGGFTFETK